MSPDLCVLCLLSIHRLRETVSLEHVSLKQNELENMSKASHGYGGKFGVQEDRMDKVGGRRSEERTGRSLIHPLPPPGPTHCTPSAPLCLIQRLNGPAAGPRALRVSSVLVERCLQVSPQLTDKSADRKHPHRQNLINIC